MHEKLMYLRNCHFIKRWMHRAKSFKFKLQQLPYISLGESLRVILSCHK